MLRALTSADILITLRSKELAAKLPALMGLHRIVVQADSKMKKGGCTSCKMAAAKRQQRAAIAQFGGIVQSMSDVERQMILNFWKSRNPDTTGIMVNFIDKAGKPTSIRIE